MKALNVDCHQRDLNVFFCMGEGWLCVFLDGEERVEGNIATQMRSPTHTTRKAVAQLVRNTKRPIRGCQCLLPTYLQQETQ